MRMPLTGAKTERSQQYLLSPIASNNAPADVVEFLGEQPEKHAGDFL